MPRNVPSLFHRRHTNKVGSNTALAEYWYNTTHQTSTGMTPFEALYGRKLPTIARYIKGIVGSPLVEEFMLNRDAILTLFRQNLSKA